MISTAGQALHSACCERTLQDVGEDPETDAFDEDKDDQDQLQGPSNLYIYK